MDKCEDFFKCIREGIDIFCNNFKVYRVFIFMNEVMYI